MAFTLFRRKPNLNVINQDDLVLDFKHTCSICGCTVEDDQKAFIMYYTDDVYDIGWMHDIACFTEAIFSQTRKGLKVIAFVVERSKSKIHFRNYEPVDLTVESECQDFAKDLMQDYVNGLNLD